MISVKDVTTFSKTDDLGQYNDQPLKSYTFLFVQQISILYRQV
jgi:hypothetical protein